jgi:hypothetical protein
MSLQVHVMSRIRDGHINPEFFLPRGFRLVSMVQDAIGSLLPRHGLSLHIFKIPSVGECPGVGVGVGVSAST